MVSVYIVHFTDLLPLLMDDSKVTGCVE